MKTEQSWADGMREAQNRGQEFWGMFYENQVVAYGVCGGWENLLCGRVVLRAFAGRHTAFQLDARYWQSGGMQRHIGGTVCISGRQNPCI